MTIGKNRDFHLDSDSIVIHASYVQWDTEALGVPVAHLQEFRIKDNGAADAGFSRFKSWCRMHRFGLVSCRLSHQLLIESMFLESNGFRFIETVIHPEMLNLQKLRLPDVGLKVETAAEHDLPILTGIAGDVFKTDRFHVDPRIDSSHGDLRYSSWVQSSYDNPQQQLLKISIDETIVAFFIVEYTGEEAAYWHLTAVDTEFQGRGYGGKAALAMLRYHREQGRNMVRTTISTRNTRVLNLCSLLGFRFSSPEMTFHWIR